LDTSDIGSGKPPCSSRILRGILTPLADIQDTQIRQRRRCIRAIEHVPEWRYAPTVTGKDLVRLLQQQGWRFEHVRGSHHVLRKEGKQVSVPVHAGKDLGKGLVARLLKETGLK
jgi:predicted RNA binding protein YcfA (HicA-like mRNA interferase family)